MLWVTRNYVHFDRVASAWLIKRFVDRDAEFTFVKWQHEDQAPPEAMPFATPGAVLGPHNPEGTTFAKILRHYTLRDQALVRIESAIAKAIDSVIVGYRPDADDDDGQIGMGLLAVAEGMVLVRRDDPSILEASFPVYDALYAFLRTSEAVLTMEGLEQVDMSDPRGPVAIIDQRRSIYDQLQSTTG